MESRYHCTEENLRKQDKSNTKVSHFSDFDWVLKIETDERCSETFTGFVDLVILLLRQVGHVDLVIVYH